MQTYPDNVLNLLLSSLHLSAGALDSDKARSAWGFRLARNLDVSAGSVLQRADCLTTLANLKANKEE